MATKKKATKKAAKPAKKAAAKKPAKKAAPKKAAAKKPAKKAAPKKASPKKAAPKKAALKKATAKKPLSKKAVAEAYSKSLVSVKPKVKPIVKKEPVRTGKVVIPKTSTKKVKKYRPEFTKSVLDAAIQDPSAPSQRYPDSDLAEFKAIILRKLDAAKKELNYLQGLITRKDESGDMDEGRYMTMEDGSVSMEREQLSQMASRQITFIDHLEKAMMRIENKTYGICRVTGRLIDKARLRAVPHATLSIEAKQMMNK